MPPQILRDQLTLSQPGGGGRSCPPYYWISSGFLDLLTALYYTHYIKDGRNLAIGKKGSFIMSRAQLILENGVNLVVGFIGGRETNKIGRLMIISRVWTPDQTNKQSNI